MKDGADSFCCLGVLCQIHAEETGGYWEEPNSEEEYKLSYLGEDASLPHAVAEWAGLKYEKGDDLSIGGSEDPYIGGAELSTHNDGLSKNFKQIAKILNERPA